MSKTLTDTSNIADHTRIRTPTNYKGKGKAVLVDGAPPLETPSTAIPKPVFLLCLPFLLQHPPDHPNYIPSLYLSLEALRKCIALQMDGTTSSAAGLSFDQECRMYGTFAEVGLRVLEIQHGDTDDTLQREVDQAIAQGNRLCQRISALRHYKPQFTVLRAYLLLSQDQVKSSRALLKAEIWKLNSSDASAAHYTLFLAYLSALLASDSSDVSGALTLLNRLQDFSTSRKDFEIGILAQALRLQVLINANMWDLVPEACGAAESALGLTFSPPSSSPSGSADGSSSPVALPTTPVTPAIGSSSSTAMSVPDSPLVSSLKVQVLLLSVVYHTHANSSKEAAARLTSLHTLLDSDVLSLFPDGVLEAPVQAGGPPLILNTSHPRKLYELTYLVSSVSKRDVIGRRPKRKLFATEGVAMTKELEKAVPFSFHATLSDVRQTQEKLDRIKADMLCEMLSICIMRSEFDDAERSMHELVAHLRRSSMFDEYAARITLLRAYHAHATGKSSEALECYAIVVYLASTRVGRPFDAKETAFLRLAARVGEVALRIGMKDGAADEDFSELTESVILECNELAGDSDGVLAAYGKVFEAIIAPEITEIKTLLKSALEIVTRSSDNHTRGLVLALLSNLYLLTASEHAQMMLQMCKQLAAGLGAASQSTGKDQEAVVGNAPLGLWVGERFLEMYNREKKHDKARRQQVANRMLSLALNKILARPPPFIPKTTAHGSTPAIDDISGPLQREDAGMMDIDSSNHDEMDTGE